MLATELASGLDYAHRLNPQDPECGFQKVTFIGSARAGKAKVRHQGGELDGLEEWVRTRTLMCRWGERSPFLRDESRWTVLRQAAARDHDPVVEEAISAVLDATGEENGFIRVWTVSPERARRLWRRAGLSGQPDHHSLAYTDRHGQMNLPYETALEFARAFAAAEPEPCIHYIQEWEDGLRAEGHELGQRSRHTLLRALRPAHALVREWAQAGGLELLGNENIRLRRLLREAIAALRQARHEQQASRIERALRGGLGLISRFRWRVAAGGRIGRGSSACCLSMLVPVLSATCQARTVLADVILTAGLERRARP
jgi:hypothetical protein